MPKQKVSEKYVLKQSLKVFRRKGYYHTSMQDIAEVCGLTKGSLYHYYKGKEELMRAVLTFMHNYYVNEVFIIAYDKQLGLQQKLRFLVEASENQFFASENGCMFGNLALETSGNKPDFSDMVQHFFNDWKEAMFEIYKEKYDEQTAKDLAKDVVARIEGAVMMVRLYKDKEYLRRAHKDIIHQFENGSIEKASTIR